MAMTLAHLAWQVARAQAIHDMAQPLGGPGVCAWTGVECDETWPFRPSNLFGDWPDIARPDSRRAHPGCAWLAGKSSVIGPSGSRLRWVLMSLCASSAGLQHAGKAQKGLVREWILDPPEPPFAVLVADGGKRHWAWRTPVNESRERFLVRLDALLVDVDAERMRNELAEVEALYKAGMPKADIAQGETTPGRLRRIDLGLWRSVRARAGTPRHELAVWLARKEEHDS